MSNDNAKKNVLIIFDLVSTLTNAAPRYVRAFQDVCAASGTTPPSEDDVQAMLGNKNLSEITDAVMGAMDKDLKGQFMNACNQTCDALLNRPDWHEALYPHVRETIEALHNAGMTLGIFTGTREDAMENQLYYHGIHELFDARYIRGKNNERDHWKKNEILKTEQLVSIVEAFQQDHAAGETMVIIVGDSSADAEAAANLGSRFIGFAENDKKYGRLEKAGVTNIVRDFSDLPAMIAKCSAEGAQKTAAPQPAVTSNRSSVAR